MQHDFILLDRSGSMQSMWTEAVNSINGYVKKLAEDKVDTGVTLATFDKDGHEVKFDIIRDRITPPTWAPVKPEEAPPRGMTPLNDAIGHIVTLARKGFNGTQYEKVAIIIMTDGHENASREYTHATAKALLDDCRAKNWQVIFLGANFDNALQAQSYGNAASQTISATPDSLLSTLTNTARSRSIYGATGQAMSYTDEDKKEALKQSGG